MALLFPESACAICGQKIGTDSNLFTTSGVVFAPPHPLYKFCDAPMHWACYEAWEHRPEFARGCFESFVASEQRNPYWGMAYLSEQVAVQVNPDPAVAQVSVDLAETGSSIRVPLEHWQIWVSDPDAASAGSARLEQAALASVLPRLRETLPDAETLISRVEWTAKQAVRDAMRERHRQAEEVRFRKPSAHNKACRQIMRDGAVCPFCGGRQNIRFIDKSPQEKSYFICDRCARSFGPVEVAMAEPEIVS